MNRIEFELSKQANLRALFALYETPDLKVIDLVELLQEQNPSSPVVIQVGAQRYSIENVGVDNDKKVQIITSEANGRTNIL
jgi:hypothetical protein